MHKRSENQDLSQCAETDELSSSEVVANWLLSLINIKDYQELQHVPPMFPCCSCLIKIPVIKRSRCLRSKKMICLK